MPNYDSIDPSVYLARFEQIPRERYLREHWHPLTSTAIHRYCRGELVVDLGCGFGDYTRELEAASLRIGVDLASRWLRHAREYVGVQPVRGDAQRIPLGDRVCDAVLSVGLLEYGDTDLMIGEIARVLRPGRFCVVSCVNKYSAYRLTLRVLLRLRGRAYEVREVSLPTIKRSMRRHGVDPIETIMDDGLIWLPDWVDRRVGMLVYRTLEVIAKRLRHNPFSNGILIVGQRRI